MSLLNGVRTELLKDWGKKRSVTACNYLQLFVTICNYLVTNLICQSKTISSNFRAKDYLLIGNN